MFIFQSSGEVSKWSLHLHLPRNRIRRNIPTLLWPGWNFSPKLPLPSTGRRGLQEIEKIQVFPPNVLANNGATPCTWKSFLAHNDKICFRFPRYLCVSSQISYKAAEQTIDVSLKCKSLDIGEQDWKIKTTSDVYMIYEALTGAVKHRVN